MTQTTPSNKPPCPIWGESPAPMEIPHGGRTCNSPRAGGRFLLEYEGAVQLKFYPLSNRQRANLSYWIYAHNLRYRLFDDSTAGEPPVLDKKWVEVHRNSEPSAEDRMLNFLRESIRDWDAGEERRGRNSDLKMAAGGCRTALDLAELANYAAERGWLGVRTESGFKPTRRVNLPARIYVEERTRELAQGRQGFVAMSFDPSLKCVFEQGIGPALEDAGYRSLRIDQTDFTGGVVDRIMAEIRKSKFVVADFTACWQCTADQPCKKNGAPGGVYYEAGFAQGLDIPVFLTCRKSCAEAVHFDIDHINRLEWNTLEEFRCRLKRRIEAVLGRGPLDLPDGHLRQQQQPVRTAT